MSIKLKALGLALFAALAVGAVSVVSATAETGGHFTSDVEWTHIEAEQEGSLHDNVFIDNGWEQSVTCETSTYTASVGGKTVTEVTVEAEYGGCETTSGYPAVVDMNGCHYALTIGPEPESKDQTTHLVCPEGEEIELKINPPIVGECHIHIPPQTPTAGGVVYTPIEVGGKQALTLDITAEGITSTKESTGFGCGGASGESNNSALEGTVVAEGFDTSKNLTNITALGPQAMFKSEVDHTLITGSQVATNEYTFGVLLGGVKCEVATFDGTIAKAEVGEITIKPAYSKCEGVQREVTTHMNGCAYVLTITGEVGTHGRVDIECPAGKAIETTVDKFPEGCTLTIGKQTAGGVVDYKEEGSGSTRDLLLTWTLTGIHYSRDGCEIGGTGNNGTYSGSVTLKGENTSGEQKGIWIE